MYEIRAKLNIKSDKFRSVNSFIGSCSDHIAEGVNCLKKSIKIFKEANVFDVRRYVDRVVMQCETVICDCI